MNEQINVWSLSVKDRKELILNQAGNLNECDEIEKSKALSGVINQFLPSFFEKRFEEKKEILASTETFEQELLKLIEAFKPEALQTIQNSLKSERELKASSQNIYEMSGARMLAASNQITRNLSTKLGELWEKIAYLSPYTIRPEIDFDLKIQGIDLIIRNSTTQTIEYVQLKTQKNTLTGSQKPRALTELSVHENPVFGVALDNKGNWTFSSQEIPRRAGEDFWSSIGLSYALILPHIKTLLSDLEDDFLKIVTSQD